MATVEKYTFLDEVGIKNLSEALLGKVNIRVAERIVQEISEASDAKHVPSAILVHNLLKGQTTAIGAVDAKAVANAAAIGALDTKVTGVAGTVTTLEQKVDSLTHLTLDTVTGPIADVENPDPQVLYLQRDNESDTSWLLYIYRAAVMEGETVVTPAKWIEIGDTEVDLSGYWKKTDVTEMREALGIHDVQAMTPEQITAAVDEAFAKTEVFTQAPQ